MVGIALYRRKLREKRLRNEDYSMIMSKLTKSRAFTGKEMADATQDFSTQIGQGGSGSVFLGKLREEKDIAVKVLSSLHQFLNEVDVLSRAQHKNLVSLIGYCSESKNLMLVYEHMSGGSLWDSLHGRNADHSNLNWKTRLKIALDAAQGLEFLHVRAILQISITLAAARACI
nr:LRR1 [Picea wilsonii]